MTACIVCKAIEIGAGLYYKNWMAISTAARLDWFAFGEYIAMRRKKLGMTQSEFALAINRKQPDVSAFELARVQPSLETFIVICHALKVSPENTLRRFLKK